jgi:hypothetical protein
MPKVSRVAARRFVVGVAAVVVALFAVGIVVAANPDKERISFTAAGRAQAKAEVVRRADLGAGWRGGLKKPDLSSTMPDCSYRPKQSDLVLIGAAESTWQKQLFEVDSETQVLRTPTMVRLDWQRTVLAPQVQPCLRKGLAKSLGSHAKLVSFSRVAFPHVARYVRAYRVVADVKTTAGALPVEIDVVVLEAGRSEVTLTLTGLAAAKAALHSEDVRLARLLVHRLGP